MEQLEVGIESTEGECWAKTGKAPVTTTWVRVNKGTSSNPFFRARLVARDFKTKGGESLFAAMPPLEAKKLLFRMAAKEQRVWRRGRWERRKLMFIDVKKAHLNGKVPDDEFAFVKLPDGKIWRLKRWYAVCSTSMGRGVRVQNDRHRLLAESIEFDRVSPTEHWLSVRCARRRLHKSSSTRWATGTI